MVTRSARINERGRKTLLAIVPFAVIVVGFITSPWFGALAAACIVGTFLFVRFVIPHVNTSREYQKIIKVKAKQDMSRHVKISIDASHDSQDTLASEVKPSEGFALVHMGPPEIIDLDLNVSARRGKHAPKTDRDFDVTDQDA